MIENGKVYGITLFKCVLGQEGKKLSTTVRSVVTEVADETPSTVFV